MILPYVYKLTNRVTKEYYFGYRSKNVQLGIPSTEDLGIIYFTSSKYVKPIFSEFDIEILAEFFSKDGAYEFEQSLILEHIKDPKCINKHYQYNTTKKFKHDVPHTESGKSKMRGPRGKINRTSPGHSAWNKGLTKNNDIRMAKLSISRKLAGNKHQIGRKLSANSVDKIRQKLLGREVPFDQRQKMSQAKKGKSWETIYGIDEAEKRRNNTLTGSKHPNAKAVNTPAGIFGSVTEAAKYFNLTDVSVRVRCNNKKDKWADWFYINLD